MKHMQKYSINEYCIYCGEPNLNTTLGALKLKDYIARQEQTEKDIQKYREEKSIEEMKKQLEEFCRQNSNDNIEPLMKPKQIYTFGNNFCLFCGLPGGHGNLRCPKMICNNVI